MTRLSALMIAALAVAAHALPNHLSDALDWSAGKVSRLGSEDSGVHTATQWSFTDCGPSFIYSLEHAQELY